MGPLRRSDFVLVKKGGRAYAAYVAELSADGEHYVVRQLTGDAADDVTVNDVSRSCR